MLGQKHFTPKLFYHLSLEQLVPADHLLRRVAAVVDFSFVRRQTARFYSTTGQPGVDPEVLFKMALIGWLYGITSERRLADDVSLHLAYRWFLGYDLDEATPNHSVLSKARRRFGLWVYESFFDEVVRQCKDAGLIQGDHLYIDSTLIAANASLESLTSRALLTEVSGYVKQLFTENPAEPAGDQVEGQSSAPDEPVPGASATDPTPPDDGTALSLSAVLPVAAESAQVELLSDEPPARPETTDPAAVTVLGPPPAIGAEATAPLASSEPDAVPYGPAYPLHRVLPTDPPTTREHPVNVMLVSRTDPDASYLTRAGIKRGLYHKVHVGTDAGRHRIATVVHVTSGATSDESQCVHVIGEHERRVGVSVREATADTTYGTEQIYTELTAVGIRANMSPLSKALHRTLSPLITFEYDAEADQFTCSNGSVLHRAGTGGNGGGTRTQRYRAKPADCAACSLKAICSPGTSRRSVTRPLATSVQHEVAVFLETPEAKRHRKLRKCFAETTNAELKEHHGLRRTPFRYHPRVQMHAFGAGIGYNIKKLVAALAPRGGSGGSRFLSSSFRIMQSSVHYC